MKRLLLLSFFAGFMFTSPPSSLAGGKDFPACTPDLPVGTWCRVKLDALHPTQPEVGKHEVKLKYNQYKNLSRKEMTKLKIDKVVPVVIGPDGNYYLVDHHHTSLALIEAGEEEMNVKVLENWSDTGAGKEMKDRMVEFWERMKGKQYCFLKLSDGTVIDPLSSLFPKTLKACGNNRYRALAYLLIENKIITGVSMNYYEFYVAEELRKLGVIIKPGRLKKAIKEAHKLLKTAEGQAAIARAGDPNCYLQMVQALVTRP